MQTVQEIKNLADSRLKEARLLYDNGYYDGAAYIVGYAVELILKAKVCELLEVPDFFHENSSVDGKVLRSFKTHDLEALLILSGLRNKFQLAKRNNIDLADNWIIICEWSENRRYLPKGTFSAQNTLEFLNAISDNQNGFKTWIENI